ncbi:MAG: response regulator transcription factor [Deltaproteobacteria bacterium]|nr:response regulator transcription factor [Deltaproteobacteria bacterium]
MIRVMLVDDQRLIREGIEILLNLEQDIEVVGMAANGAQALQLAQELRPDVVLMDVRMPEMDGIAATRTLTKDNASIRVIILTTFDDDEYIFEGIKAGAMGYLLKDISSEEMADAIRTVHKGEALIQPAIARKVVTEFSRLASGGTGGQKELAVPLTDRELDVLKAMAEGLSNREISKKLHITEGTVKNHVSNLLTKLNTRDRIQAVLKAQRLSLV